MIRGKGEGEEVKKDVKEEEEVKEEVKEEEERKRK